MDKKAFERVVSSGSLSWDQKNPIGFLYFPTNNCQNEPKNHNVTEKPVSNPKQSKSGKASDS